MAILGCPFEVYNGEYCTVEHAKLPYYMWIKAIIMNSQQSLHVGVLLMQSIL